MFICWLFIFSAVEFKILLPQIQNKVTLNRYRCDSVGRLTVECKSTSI
jgi:hypothetical protein